MKMRLSFIIVAASLAFGTGTPAFAWQDGGDDYSAADTCLSRGSNGITNHCDYPVEANWISTNGSKNMWTIGPGQTYPARDAVRVVGCRANRGMDWSRGGCRK